MAVIKKNFGNAGAGGHQSGGKPYLASALRDVADEMAELKALVDALRTGLTASGKLVPSATNVVLDSTVTYRINGIPHGIYGGDSIGPPVTTTGAGEFAKDLITADAGGSTNVTGGVKTASQAEAVLPDAPANEAVLGWIEVPENFTPGVTTVMQGMLKEAVMPDFTPKTIKG